MTPRSFSKPILVALLLITTAVISADLVEQIEYTTRLCPGLPVSTAAVERLTHLASSRDSEVQRGIKMVLQEQLFTTRIAASHLLVTVDGRAQEWGGFRLEDSKGDGPVRDGHRIDAADIVAASYAISEKNELAIFIESAAAPALDTGVQISIDINGDYQYDLVFQVYRSADGTEHVTSLDQRGGKERIDHTFSWAVAEGYELVIPLQPLLGDDRLCESPPILATMWVGGADRADHTEFWRYPREPNFALLLLLHLLDEDPEPDTLLPFALALANNNLYALGSAATRTAILSDLADHHRFYAELVAWQEQVSSSYRLRDLPLIPLTLWADRIRTGEYKDPADGRVPIERYTEFVDSIEDYRRVHRMAIEYSLYTHSLSQTSRRLEEFVVHNQLYRAGLDAYCEWNARGTLSDRHLSLIESEYASDLYSTEYFGQVRGPYMNGWLGRQLELNDKTGHFVGDCGTYTTMQMAFYRCAGIPTVSFQWYNAHGSAAYTHNFPCYYASPTQKWTAYQRPRDSETPLYLHMSKPVWHHARFVSDYRIEGQAVSYRYYPGEHATDSAIVHLLDRGITNSRFDRIFLGDETLVDGLFFDAESAPPRLPDRDVDSLLDDEEVRWGTDPDYFDSDGDGINDWIEVDYGYDPANPASPGADIYAPSCIAYGFLAGVPTTDSSDNLLRIRTDYDTMQTYWNEILALTEERYMQERMTVAGFDTSTSVGTPIEFLVDIPAGTRIHGILDNTLTGERLSGHVTARRVDDDLFHLRAMPPAGTYKLSLYDVREGQWYWFAELGIDVLRDAEYPTAKSHEIIAPFPSWTTYRYDLAMVHTEPEHLGTIRMIDLETELTFRSDDNRELAFNLVNADGEGVNGFHRARRENNRYSVTVQPPLSGSYRLNVFEVVEGRWEFLAEHRVVAEQDAPYPRQDGSVTVLAPYPVETEHFRAAGLKLLEPSGGWVTSEGPLTVRIAAPEGTVIWHNLNRILPDGKWEAVTDGSTHGWRDGAYEIVVTVSEPGTYAVSNSIKIDGEWEFGGYIKLERR